MRRLLLITAIMAFTMGIVAQAADEWPSSLEIAGFKVNQISGKTEKDGSGKATGKLQLPGGGSCSVDLNRSASGVITGSTRANFSIGGVRIEGSFLLDRRGMQGTGTIITRGRPISDANMKVNPKTGVSGRGVVYLTPKLPVSVTYEVRKRDITVRGSLPSKASVDTPLALYTFKGDLLISSSGASLCMSAKGSVERKGKIGGMVSTFGPLKFNVDMSTGEGRVNVGGANITLDLW